jgi:hypothetical protein
MISLVKVHHHTAKPLKFFPGGASPTIILPIGYVNQIEDKAAAHGDWESSGILDVSTYFGEGAWLVDVQAHTIGEGGQLLLLRIPGS